jgi:cation transport regulator ChaB
VLVSAARPGSSEGAVPYGSNAELPQEVRDRYSSRCQTVFREVFNETDGDEGKRFRVAHTAARNCEESKAMDGMLVKSATPLDLELKDDGSVVVAFARIGMPGKENVKDIDSDGDVSLKGSIPTKSVPISAYSHNSWAQRGGLLPSGRGDIKEDGSLAVMRGRFFLKTSHGQDTYETVKEMGNLQEWSHGYTVEDAEAGTWAGEPANLISKFDIHEVSPVLLGAGNDTATLAIKSRGGYDPDDEGAASRLSYADHAGRVLSEVDAFVKRSQELSDLRTKDGRKLGPKAKAQIEDFIGGVDKVIEMARAAADLRTQLRDLIRDDDSGKANEALRLEAEFRALQTNLISLGYEVQT